MEILQEEFINVDVALKRDAIYGCLCSVINASKKCLKDPKSIVQYTNDVLFDLSDSIDMPGILVNFREKLMSKMH